MNRRHFLLSGLVAGAALATPAVSASDVRDLNWKDLVPLKARGAGNASPIISHSTIPSRTFTDPRHYAIVPELDRQRVRLPGYLVPLDFDGLGGVEFLLVPFIGACIHVPPPPPNQLVHALIEKPYRMKGLFDPVYAVGELRTVFEQTELASASYTLHVEDFEAVTF